MIAYLRRAPDVAESEGREVQIGGPDVLSYGDMLDRMADALGDPADAPGSRCRCSRPWLSSLWIGLVTPVDAGVARPLIEGLSTPTTVTDPSGAAPFGIDRMPVHRGAAAGACRGSRDRRPRMSAELRLYPDRLGKVPRTGAVESVQERGARLDEPASQVVSRGFLRWAAATPTGA